ncbi:MAG: metallophosphoesterase [Flavobacterium sp.]
MIFRLVIFFSFIILIEVYAFYAFKIVLKNKTYEYIYIAINVLIIAYIIYSFTQFDRTTGQTSQSLFVVGLLFITFIPKLVLSGFLFLEDITRLIRGIFNLLSSENKPFLPKRREFISQIAIFTASIPFFSILYGVTKGKYNFKVIKQKITFKNLPDAFHGFTITQISDIHSGSLDNQEKVDQAIATINELNSDMVVFTGDIVNTLAKEFYPWIESFKKITPHKYGKFSILGNHDYGEYLDWRGNEKAKSENFLAIKNLHQAIDFQLLLNENQTISKNNQTISILGVENWGKSFKKAGDLSKTLHNVNPDSFKILLSHDPSHWDNEVQNYHIPIDLTLSGHTHGLQFGIEIPGFFKWSPVQYVYKQWAGLYQNAERYLYVNRGFGFHGYPGRVGIMPEITQITLLKD